MEILNLGGSYEPSARSPKKKFKVVLGIGLLAAVMGMGSTLAASITLNSGSAVEFGQGIATATACDSSITVTPNSSYTNAATGDFLFSSVSISTVDSSTAGCAGKTFVLKAFATGNGDTSTTGPAYLYAIDSTTASPLYLGWKYSSGIVTGGSAASGAVYYNNGVAITLGATTGSTCTVTVSGTNKDKTGTVCTVTPGASGLATYTITFGGGTNATYGVPTSAVAKITLESLGSAPSTYA